jgi:hypothetical protein
MPVIDGESLPATPRQGDHRVPLQRGMPPANGVKPVARQNAAQLWNQELTADGFASPLGYI